MEIGQGIKTKIQRLLALAGNNPNEAEREQAMVLAQGLLAKHNLSMLDVQGLSGVGESEMSTIKVEPWITNIMLGVSKLYYCSIFLRNVNICRYGKPRNVKSYVLVGSPENIEVAKEVATWLIATVRKEARQIFKDAMSQKSFRVGASYAIKLKADAIRQAELEALNPQGDTNGGYALMVLRNDLERLNAEYMAQLGDMQAQKQRSVKVDRFALIAGQAYGNSLHLGRQIACSGEEPKRITSD